MDRPQENPTKGSKLVGILRPMKGWTPSTARIPGPVCLAAQLAELSTSQ